MLGRDYEDYYCSAVNGGKVGSTDKAGYCAVSTASKNGYAYMLIVMGAEYYDIDKDGTAENTALTESRRVYDWVFENIVLQKITSTTDVVTVVDLKYNSNVDHVRLVPAQELSALIPKGTETGSLEIVPIPELTPTVLEAPVKKGDIVGKANVFYGDTIIGTVDLMVAEDVKRNTFIYIFSKLGDFFDSFFSSIIFKILIIIAVLLVILYILLIIRKKRIIAKRKKIKMIKG
jgi:D-alanyl-D-alanine carboxypeptidase (penicillin-binding protein 5/6)